MYALYYMYFMWQAFVQDRFPRAQMNKSWILIKNFKKKKKEKKNQSMKLFLFWLIFTLQKYTVKAFCLCSIRAKSALTSYWLIIWCWFSVMDFSDTCYTCNWVKCGLSFKSESESEIFKCPTDGEIGLLQQHQIVTSNSNSKIDNIIKKERK